MRASFGIVTIRKPLFFQVCWQGSANVGETIVRDVEYRIMRRTGGWAVGINGRMMTFATL